MCFKVDWDEVYCEFIDKCVDFEVEIVKECVVNYFIYVELEENDVDLKKLQGWIEKICKFDFYGVMLVVEVIEKF